MKYLSVTLALLVVVLIVGKAEAQATTTSKIIFDQQSPTLVAAQAYTYRIYEGAVGTILAGVTCLGATSPFTCSATFPAFTPGNHTITMTAAEGVNESIKGAPFSFTFVVIPTPPQNIRIG